MSTAAADRNAVADIGGNGSPDLVVFHLDNPDGENLGFYRVGWNLDNGGRVTGGWSPVLPVPGWFGTQSQGAGIVVGDFTGAHRPEIVVYHVDNPDGENIAYLRIGRDLATDGTVSSWSEIRQVSGWAGADTQGAGLAAGDINGDGIAELVCLQIENTVGENQAYYKVSLGRGDRNGDFVNRVGGWAPGGLGTRVWKSGRTTELTNGSITDVDATFDVYDHKGLWGHFTDQFAIRPGISQPGDSGSFVVDALNRVVGLLFAGSDKVTICNRIENVLEALRYSDVRAVPGWFGAESQGADIATADLTGNGRQDLLVFHIDNPDGENHGFYRVGYDLSGTGTADGGWTGPIAVPGWFGSESQGAGIAVTPLPGTARPALIVFLVDNPDGEDHGHYRAVFDLMPSGLPARWSIT